MAKKDRWTQGFTCAVVILIQLEGLVSTSAKELFRAGLGKTSIPDLEESGVDDADLQILREHWADLYHNE